MHDPSRDPPGAVGPPGYYADKAGTLRSLFGVEDVVVDADAIRVAGRRYPVIDDVIVLLEPEGYTDKVREALVTQKAVQAVPVLFARDIQFTFGAEWKAFGGILPEYEAEFGRYFDLLDPTSLAQLRVCDLGCGMGRWSAVLKNHCREVILVDFSDAIFQARANLRSATNCLFFMGDLERLPFAPDCCDLIVCLGVLHHLATPCLEALRRLRSLAPRFMIFLYSSMDNRPFYFSTGISLVTLCRHVLWHVRSVRFRKWFSRAVAYGVYLPLVWLGRALGVFGWSSHVPLYDSYQDKGRHRTEQDVYDRFFTRIEQRVSRQQILELQDSFGQVIVSGRHPYWHFLCVR